MAALPVIAGIGLAVQAGGQIMGAAAKADAASRDAALKYAQADELLAREKINEEIMSRKGLEIQSDYQNAGGGLGGALRIQRDVHNNIINAGREAQFKAYMLREGANIETSLASDTMTASYIGAGGSVLGFGANLWDKYGKFSSDSHLPTVGDSEMSYKFGSGSGYNSNLGFGNYNLKG